MFKRLLVPLDGSRLAESVLPAAGFLGKTSGASVVLFHVIEKNAPAQIHGEPHLNDTEEARMYLKRVAQLPHLAGLRVAYHVHISEAGNVAKNIVENATEFDSDLIVMCTHGWGGLRDWLFGSIAQQVIARGLTPVLVIQPYKDEQVSAFTCRRMLVPLDGNPDHEHGIPVSVRMAQLCKSSLNLIMVVPTWGALSGEWTATRRLLPGATRKMLDMDVKNAEAYLIRRHAELERSGLSIQFDILRGDPAEVVADAADRLKADLIVMGTHGRAGMEAFWAGSLTQKVCRKCRTPLLMVPVRKK